MSAKAKYSPSYDYAKEAREAAQRMLADFKRDALKDFDPGMDDAVTEEAFAMAVAAEVFHKMTEEMAAARGKPFDIKAVWTGINIYTLTCGYNLEIEAIGVMADERMH